MITNKKEIAIQCLEKLEIYKPYIRKFKSKAGIPCFFENYGGFYADQEEELYAKIKEVEAKYECLVYAITHEFTQFGETYSMLCVPRDLEPAEELLIDAGMENYYYAFSYVWNRTEEYFSEFGDIIVRTFGGGIKRVE